MKKLQTYLMLSLLCLWVLNAYAEDASVTTVVYLKQNVLKTVEQNGQEYQLWLKRPEKNTAKPFFDVHSGTGLFISIDNQPYLVTASHVSEKMTIFLVWLTIMGYTKNIFILRSNFSLVYYYRENLC